MPLRVLDDRDFDYYVSEPAVIGFVRRRDPGCRDLVALLEALAPVHGPRVHVALVDLQDSPGVAARYAIDRVPTVMLFDDYRPCGVLGDPITRAALEDLITTRLR